jgi:hypothetical protein
VTFFDPGRRHRGKTEPPGYIGVGMLIVEFIGLTVIQAIGVPRDLNLDLLALIGIIWAIVGISAVALNL